MIQLILKYLKINDDPKRHGPREWYNDSRMVEANGGYVVPYTR